MKRDWGEGGREGGGHLSVFGWIIVFSIISDYLFYLDNLSLGSTRD